MTEPCEFCNKPAAADVVAHRCPAKGGRLVNLTPHRTQPPRQGAPQ